MQHTAARTLNFGQLIMLAALLSPELWAAEPEDPRRPPAIVTESVPLVSPQLAERLQAYQNVREAAFCGWAPDGRGILIATRFGDTTQLHRVYEPGGRRDQVTFFAEPVSGRFLPGNDDRTILVSMGRGGDENYQIYRLDRDRGTSTLLTDGQSRNELGPVARDGRLVVFSSNRRNGRDTDLFGINPHHPESARMILETSSQYYEALDLSLDARRLLVNHVVSINETYPAVIDLPSGAKTPVPPPGAAERPLAFGDLAFTPDAASAYVTCDALGEFLRLAHVNLATYEYQWRSDNIPWDVSELEVNPTSGELAFTVNANGASELYLVAGQSTRRIALPLGIASSLEFSPDGRHLGLTLSRPDAPADAYSIDTKSGELTRWTFSEVGGLIPATFVVPEQIEFRSFDGRQIPVYYYRPRGASREHPAPVLISIHGGPESQFRPEFSGVTQFYVNELGLAVLAPNVRGSSGYGKSYLRLDNAERREDSVRDIGALLDWIAQKEELDASRVAVIGGSYGGYMVLSSLVHFSDRIRAGVDIVGIASFITFLERTQAYRQDLRRAEYGDERDPAMRKVFERIDPLANADRIRAALLVAHGCNDPRVPFFEAQQIAEKVRATGRPVWTVYADNEGHGFAKKPNRDYLTAVIATFLQKQLELKPLEREAPGVSRWEPSLPQPSRASVT
jgi:dipeptidyl aminopeptidase/acylaminoacyl peptidase